MIKFILCAIFSIVFTQVTFAAMPPSFRPGRLTLEADSEYFWTKENYDVYGETQALINNNSYNNLTNSFHGTYFLDGSWSLGGGFGYAYANSSSFEDRSNGTLTQLFAKGQKLFSISHLRIIPEAKLTVALDTIDKNRDEAITSEGTNEFLAGSWLTFDLWRIRTYGFLGYQYRDDGRAHLMPWTGGLALRQDRWYFSAEAAGYETVSDDEYVNQRYERTNVTGQVNAGSLRYYSVNPRLIEARGQVGVEIIRNTILSFGYGQTLLGESTAKGQSAFVSLTYNIETMASPAETLPNIEPRKSKQAEEHSDSREFQPLIEEDYDETLFEEDL